MLNIKCHLQILLLSVFVFQDVCSNDTLLVRFGLIADIQYCSCENRNNRFFDRTLARLNECVACLNNQQVQFTINLGDLTEDKQADLAPVLHELAKLEAPVYNITGNHDYKGVINNLRLYRRLGMPAGYYSFVYNNIRFVMLNTNEVASYSRIGGRKNKKELSKILSRIKNSNLSNGRRWNGGVGKVQLEWLRSQLQSASNLKQHVFIFSHHPLYPVKSFTALNYDEVLNIINEFKCVKAIFAGHHHAGAFAMFNNIPVITVEGMIEGENSTAFAEIEIYSNKIILNGRGRLQSREFFFNCVL